MTEPNGDVLIRFYREWKQAEQRRELARQTLLGGESDALIKEARFKGAAELLHGPDATYEYNEKTGLVFKQPNRETRRALAKVRKK